MVKIYVSENFDKTLNKFMEKEKKDIHNILTKLSGKNNPALRQILNSDLYAKKIKNLVLIFSKKKEGLYLMDIMKKKDFDKEFEKSINFFL